jgi:UDP-3-O-acyl-N-acetylglucosamine deacetylase
VQTHADHDIIRTYDLCCTLVTHKLSQTRKVEKLLAALNLPQVGEIKLVDPDADDPDNDGALFTIELNTRYVLKYAGTVVC